MSVRVVRMTTGHGESDTFVTHADYAALLSAAKLAHVALVDLARYTAGLGCNSYAEFLESGKGEPVAAALAALKPLVEAGAKGDGA